MKNRVYARIAVTLIAVLALVVASCSSDEDTPAPTAAPVTAAPTTVAPFDIIAAVDAYASAIPAGFYAVGDITAFKDAVAASGALLVDVREVGEYAEGHIEGAINIPLRTLADNLNKIPSDRQVFVYCKSGYRASMALSSLGMLGYDNILAFPPGWNGWTAAGEPVSMTVPTAETFTVPDIPTELLAAVSGFLSTIPQGWLSAGDVTAVKDAIGAGAALLDVRTAAEYAEGHIPNAVNVPLREIGARYNEIPTGTSLISYCKSGWRQGMSVPMLHVLGVSTAKGFTGSWKAWTEAAEPVETT
jgi:rhodanese-related sulfurtransferase